MKTRQLWMECDGASLFAVEAGDGAPVLLLHGGMADHRACLAYLESLSAGSRVIAPDQRGSGRSCWREPLSFERLAKDLLAWTETLTLGRVVIVAVSSGTGVAAHFALAHPGRVSGLALLQPVYAGSERGLAPEQAETLEWMDGLASRALEDGMEAILPLYSAAPDQIRDQAIAMAMEYDPPSLVATSRFLASGAQPFHSPADLARIQVPVLLVPGADPMHPAAVSDLYLRNLPRVEAVSPQDPMLALKLAQFCANTGCSGISEQNLS